MCVIVSATASVEVDGHVVDKDAVLTTLNVRNVCSEDVEEKIRELGRLVNPEDFRRQVSGPAAADIHYITELANDSDVTFIEQDDDDDPNLPLYLTGPYITGHLFAESVLDSLASCTYLNKEVLSLTRTLINGVGSSELELMLAEGLGFTQRNFSKAAGPQQTTRRDRCHVALFPLDAAPLDKLQHGLCYGELFIHALRTYGFLSLGLYRLLNPDQASKARHAKRYVITHPPFYFQLLSSDRVYVLKPYHHQQLQAATAAAAAEVAPVEKASGTQSRNGSTESSIREVEVDQHANTQL